MVFAYQVDSHRSKEATAAPSALVLYICSPLVNIPCSTLPAWPPPSWSDISSAPKSDDLEVVVGGGGGEEKELKMLPRPLGYAFISVSART